MKSLVRFLQCDFEVFKGVPVIIWTGLLWSGIQPTKREAGMKCLEKLVWTVLCICVCPGNATLALTRLHKHVQYAIPIQFAPYINMGVALTTTNQTNFPNLHTPDSWAFRSARAWKNKCIKHIFCWLISAHFYWQPSLAAWAKHTEHCGCFWTTALPCNILVFTISVFNPAYDPVLLKSHR